MRFTSILHSAEQVNSCLKDDRETSMEKYEKLERLLRISALIRAKGDPRRAACVDGSTKDQQSDHCSIRSDQRAVKNRYTHNLN